MSHVIYVCIYIYISFPTYLPKNIHPQNKWRVKEKDEYITKWERLNSRNRNEHWDFNIRNVIWYERVFSLKIRRTRRRKNVAKTHKNCTEIFINFYIWSRMSSFIFKKLYLQFAESIFRRILSLKLEQLEIKHKTERKQKNWKWIFQQKKKLLPQTLFELRFKVDWF